jgi:glycosyltransferase involved in cell wall biosynthesis
MQTFDDFELIICDNCSEDNTEEICRKAAAGDKRIRYRRNIRNIGAAANYNLTVELSSGKYFKWAAHDDICAPDYLKECLQAFEESPADVVLCYPRTTIIDSLGRPTDEYCDDLELMQQTPDWRFGFLLRNLKACNVAHGLIRRDALQRTRLIGRYFASDVVFLAELALLGKFKRLESRLFFRRIHPGGSRTANRTYGQVLAWFDPDKKGQLVLPLSNIFFELTRSIRRAPLNSMEKMACFVTLMEEWPARYWRQMGGEAKMCVRTLYSGLCQSLQSRQRLPKVMPDALNTISLE